MVMFHRKNIFWFTTRRGRPRCERTNPVTDPLTEHGTRNAKSRDTAPALVGGIKMFQVSMASMVFSRCFLVLLGTPSAFDILGTGHDQVLQFVYCHKSWKCRWNMLTPTIGIYSYSKYEPTFLCSCMYSRGDAATMFPHHDQIRRTEYRVSLESLISATSGKSGWMVEDVE